MAAGDKEINKCRGKTKGKKLEKLLRDKTHLNGFVISRFLCIFNRIWIQIFFAARINPFFLRISDKEGSMGNYRLEEEGKEKRRGIC